MRWLSLLALALALVFATRHAAADANHVRYTVQRGDTLSGIAAKFRVSLGSIVRYNALKKDAILAPGRKITVPLPPGRKPATVASSGSSGPAIKSWRDLAKAPANPGWVSIASYSASYTGPLVDASGRVVPDAERALTEIFIPRASGDEPRIDTRLLELIARVSDTFGGRRIRVVSGYRPGRRSRHGHGQAIDFTIDGVPNWAVRDYLLTLERVGVGYYPNSYHVHLDVRETSATWVDLSGPGQRPRYVKPKRTAKSTKAKRRKR